MALTATEKESVLNLLNDMDKSTLKRILASVEAFADWLSNSLYSIYVKVKGAIYSMWESMVNTIANAVDDVVEIGSRAANLWKIVTVFNCTHDDKHISFLIVISLIMSHFNHGVG
ncbi:hypothetical protein BGP_1360 [Beggiatoa sp. PS]|nr:hypothetical protein BGP_1360 [Beggiatoa sp. PS]